MAQVIVVERSFEKPASMDILQAREDAVKTCLEMHRVRFVGSYFSKDRLQMICLYDAPDAEAVRATQDQGELPYEHIWSAEPLLGEVIFENPHGETVVVQRSWPRALSAEDVARMQDLADGCSKRLNIQVRTSFLGAGGHRQVCVYEARDADTVRSANDELQAPYHGAWTATVHRP